MRSRLTGFGSIVLVLCWASSAWATGLGYQTRQDSSVFPSTDPQPIGFDVHHVPLEPLSPHLLHELLFEVVEFVPPDPIEPLSLVLRGSDNSREDEMGNLIPGAMGMIDVELQSAPDDDFPSEVFFDFLISANIGGTPTPIINPRIIPDAGRYFDVVFDVEVNSLAAHTARFMLPETELLIFITPEIVPNDSGFHVQGIIQRTDGVPPQQLLSVEFHGHYVPEPGTCLLMLSGFVVLTLRQRRPR